MAKQVLSIFFLFLIIFKMHFVETKCTTSETSYLISYDYKYNSHTFHLGRVETLIIIVFIIAALIYHVLQELFYEDNLDIFIAKKNARTVYIMYHYYLGTSVNLQNIFNNIDFKNYGIVAAQYGSQIKKRTYSYIKNKKVSSSYLTLLVSTDDKLKKMSQLSKIKLFGNGQVTFNLKNHGLFETVNQKLLNFLSDNNCDHSFLNRKISVKKLTVRFLYRLNLNHNIELNNITSSINDINIPNYNIYPYKNNDIIESRIITFIFAGTSRAYAKFYSNGNIYVFAHYFSNFNNHKHNLRKIFQVVKKFYP